MTQYVISRISDFAEVVTGGTPSTTNPEYWDGDIPWLNSGALNEGYITKPSRYITELGLENSSAKMMPKDTVLVALSATTGQAGYLTFAACANQSVTGILPSKEHHPQYLYFYLKTQRAKMLADAFRGVHPHINQKYVRDFRVPLPPLHDQIRIAQVLAKVEALLVARERQLRGLDELPRSLFLDMFGDPMRNDGQWETASIESLCDAIIDCPHNTPEYSKSSTGYFCIRTSDIIDGYLDLGSAFQVDEDVYEERVARYRPGLNDIVYSREGGRLGNAARILGNMPVCLGQRMMLFKAGADTRPEFLWALLESVPFKARLKGLIGGGAAPRVNIKDLRRVVLIKPDFARQSVFAEVLSKVDGLRTRWQASLVDLQQLYGALSQKAFRGELDLTRVPLPSAAVEPQPERGTLPEATQLDLLAGVPAPPQSRSTLFHHWFNQYVAQLGTAEFSVSGFLSDAMAHMGGLDDVDSSATQYEQLKVWLFEALGSGTLAQTYDDEGNRITLRRAHARRVGT